MGWYLKKKFPNANIRVITFGCPQYLSSDAVTSYSKILNNYCRIQFNKDVIITINKLYNSPGYPIFVPNKVYTGVVSCHTSYKTVIGEICKDTCTSLDRYVYIKDLTKNNLKCPTKCNGLMSILNKNHQTYYPIDKLNLFIQKPIVNSKKQVLFQKNQNLIQKKQNLLQKKTKSITVSKKTISKSNKKTISKKKSSTVSKSSKKKNI